MKLISSFRFLLPLLILTFTNLPAFSQIEGASLIIEVNGATPNKGQVIISLFSSPENFLKAPVHNQIEPVDSFGKAKLTIAALPPKIYAVSVIYDADANGELNTGFLGIPKELVGFSNNAKSSFGPPSFKKCAFELKDDKHIRIQLGKAKD